MTPIQYVNVWWPNGGRSLVPVDEAPPYEERMKYAPEDIKAGTWHGREGNGNATVFEDEGIPEWGKR